MCTMIKRCGSLRDGAAKRGTTRSVGRRGRSDTRGRAEGGGSSTGRDSRIGARGERATGPGTRDVQTWEWDMKMTWEFARDRRARHFTIDRVDSESGLNLFLSSRLSHASARNESSEERDERDGPFRAVH